MAKGYHTIFDSIELKASYKAAYPSWKPNMKSPLLQLMIYKYQDLFKEELKI
ncbi:MAG: hypothetical protein ACMUEM_01040 [Flavobacteriales bacterium AspAUS03]